MTIALSRFANVAITRATRTVSRRGFGTLLIVAYHTAWLDRVREYEDADDMVTDGFAERHPAVLAARAAFSQSPRPPSIKVGRRAGAPTQLIRLTPTSTEEGWVYTVTIGGQTATYTVAAAANLAAVCTALAAAINALTVAVTANGTSGTHVDVTADAAGSWFDYTGLDSRLSFEDRTVEPATTLATDLAAIQAEDADWYGLVVADAQSSAQIAAIAAWAETQTVFHLAHTMDTVVTTSATTDIASVLATAEYLRTRLIYNRAGGATFPNAANFARVMTQPVGAADHEYKTLTGCVPDALTSTEVSRLVGPADSPSNSKRCAIYVNAVPTGTNRGTPILYGGMVSGGEWADLIVGLDYTQALLEERAFNLRLNSPRPLFTRGGIDKWEGAVRAVLRIVSSNPHNVLDPDSITVQATPLEDTTPEQRAARVYDGVRFDARAAGSIRRIKFTGTVGA